MSNSNHQIWAVAAGNRDRSFYNILLYWDIIAMGPGSEGKWTEDLSETTYQTISAARRADLERFCQRMKTGDTVILRLGTKQVCGIGKVVGDENGYVWLDDFGDIDGWDLQHTRRVKWTKKCVERPVTFERPLFAFGATVREVDYELLDLINLKDREFMIPSKSKLVELPVSCKSPQKLDRLELNVIGEFLFDQGTSANSIDSLLSQMDELRRIAKWYQDRDERVSEHETVAYLVIPLLRALGWTPQKMAVEWNRVDIALFQQIPREDDNLIAVVEVKRFENSCLTARLQAEGYADSEARKKCNRIIVTDGIRYGIYLKEKNSNKFQRKPHAYLNLNRLIETYPIIGMGDETFGAKQALSIMAADWNGEL